jgi:putative DNA primase/helicase
MPICVHFDSEAQRLFYTWWSELEPRLRDESLPEAFVAHLAKYRSLMPSLACLFMLGDWTQERGPIPAISVRYARLAAAWCAYLESHARKVYALLMRGGMGAAQILAEKIQAGALPEVFSPRDAYRPQWAGLKGPEEVEKAAEILIDHKWLRAEEEKKKPGGGRPSKSYRINPRVTRVGAV